MRILHVLGKLDRGGAETWLVQVLRHIDREKYQMDFLVHTTDPGAYDEEVKALGARIVPCLHPSKPALYARNFFSILKEYGPYDVVHSHVHHYSGYVLMLAALAGIRARVAHSHNDTRSLESFRSLPRLGYLEAMRAMIGIFATRGLAVSGEAGDDLFLGNWRSGNKCQLQHLGIDLSRFDVDVDRNQLRRVLNIPDDAFVVGHVGRFVPQKNQAFIVEIAKELTKIEPKAVFFLIGDGPLRQEVELKVASYSLQKQFVFAGLRSDVPVLMKGVMDAFLFPSLFEGLPVTLLEVQAAGLPCLISNSISEETDIVADLVTREFLSVSASRWAERLLELRSKAQRPSSISIPSERSILASVERLTSTYVSLGHA
jgi:glycosyltransferase involved in cell wall biosynthesis